jgi:hypothetical protein
MKFHIRRVAPGDLDGPIMAPRIDYEDFFSPIADAAQTLLDVCFFVESQHDNGNWKPGFLGG